MATRTGLQTQPAPMRALLLAAGIVSAFALGSGAGYLAHDVALGAAAGGSAKTSTQVSGATAEGNLAGSAWNFSERRSGNQHIDGPAPAIPLAAGFREPTSGGRGPQL